MREAGGESPTLTLVVPSSMGTRLETCIGTEGSVVNDHNPGRTPGEIPAITD
jgi:hypothetical protein